MGLLKLIYIIWKCFLYSVFFTRSFFPDPFIVSLTKQLEFNKPLLSLLNSYNIIVNYPFSSFLILFYFTIAGRAIVRCLDVFALQIECCQKRHFYDSNSSATFTITLFFYNVIFVCSYYSLFAWNIEHPSQISVTTLLNMLYFYLVFSYFLLPVAAMHYFYFRICAKMQEIFEQSDRFSSAALIQQVTSVVCVNKQLHVLLSTPLTIFLVAITLDMVICICMLHLHFDVSILFYVGFNYFYLMYLAYLNFRIQNSLEMIANSYQLTINPYFIGNKVNFTLKIK